MWKLGGSVAHSYGRMRLVMQVVQIARFTNSISPNCLFCGLEETRSHIFFECMFSSKVLTGVFLKIGKKGPIPLSWQKVLDLWCTTLKRHAPLNLISKLAFQAILYDICLERNFKVHTNQMRLVDVVVIIIVQDIRYRVFIFPKVREGCRVA